MPEDSLVHSVKSYLRRYRLIERGERVIVAVSGGIDSMVLLDVVCTLREELRLTLAVAHVNHQLRGLDADRDEVFVRQAAKARGIECYVERADTKALSEESKRSIQDTARDIRYTFFTRLRRSIGFQKIATAHHANDNAETVLFNFFRGAGVQGLSGIPMWRRDLAVVRPLLGVTREQIRQYADARGIGYREDVSNLKTAYSRNFIRREIIPQIQNHINPNLVSTLFRTSEIFDQLERFLEEESRMFLPRVTAHRSPDEFILDLNLLHLKPVFLQEYILLQTARLITHTEIDFSTVRALVTLSNAETGSFCSISKEIIAYRNRGQLILKHRPHIRSYKYPIQLNKEYEFDDFHFASSEVPAAKFASDPHVEFADGSAFGRELMLRTWHAGDAFVPFGMKAQKKLSDFFIDEKIPLFEKQAIPILISDGDIVWVCGKRLDDRFKVTPKTKQIIKLEYQPRTATA